MYITFCAEKASFQRISTAHWSRINTGSGFVEKEVFEEASGLRLLGQRLCFDLQQAAVVWKTHLVLRAHLSSKQIQQRGREPSVVI